MADEMKKEKKLVGKVVKFFGKIDVAAIELSGPMKVGDAISVEGATTRLRADHRLHAVRERSPSRKPRREMRRHQGEGESQTGR